MDRVERHSLDSNVDVVTLQNSRLYTGTAFSGTTAAPSLFDHSLHVPPSGAPTITASGPTVPSATGPLIPERSLTADPIRSASATPTPAAVVAPPHPSTLMNQFLPGRFLPETTLPSSKYKTILTLSMAKIQFTKGC